MHKVRVCSRENMLPRRTTASKCHFLHYYYDYDPAIKGVWFNVQTETLDLSRLSYMLSFCEGRKCCDVVPQKVPLWEMDLYNAIVDVETSSEKMH